MALFGVDFYGSTHYGPRIVLSYDASPMAAEPRGQYGSLQLSWTNPGGSWSLIRLVRNSFGVPVDQDDGAVLIESNSGPAATGTVDPPVRSYLDAGLKGAQFQYYAIWLYVPSAQEWTRAAQVTGLPTRDYRYSDRLWELTPSLYRTKTEGLLDNSNTQLKSFLKVFGNQLDVVRGEYETLRDVNNPMRVSGGLLPLMAQQYGQLFEPELGMKQMRRLMANTVFLYRNKGTSAGITATVSAVAGYGATIQPLKNLILDYNTSSAEESIGNLFGDTNCSLSRYVADGTISSAPASIGSTMRAVGLFQQTAYAPGTVRARTAVYTGEGGQQTSIPISANTQYTLSGYGRRATTAPTNAFVVIFWLDAAGQYISEASSAAFTPTTTDWSVRPTVTATSPSNAVYAAFGMGYTAAAAGNIVYWDAFQFEPGGTATAYEDARLIDINALAPRVNLVPNPNFETDTTYWSSGGDGTISRDTSVYSSGSASLLHHIASSSAGFGGPYYTSPDTLPAGTYTVSMAVNAPTGYTLGYFQVDGHGEQFFGPNNVGVGTWRRYSFTFTLTQPWTAGIALFRASASAQDIHIDDVLLETGATAGTYFDGNTYAFAGDTLWEGTANNSRSHYYPQRKVKNARLGQLLAEYTPMGSSYRLNYAQPL